MKHSQSTPLGAGTTLLIVLSLLALCFIFLSCKPSDERLSEVYIVNGDIEFTYKGDNIFIETEDEEDTYYFAVKGVEYSLKHKRNNCNWGKDSTYSCDNLIIFNEQVYLAQEAL